ncbi:TetR/AcrR family transcriptional regulator [Acidiferrimicrobium sp. IK]|uniref:TetR/AcrR family transcriptional regulator n=1 Tax=Acidiferrimicrobium sp. IK TaxID=2871700 RepID=UPI0021CAECD7|nr:TetR/AcrR family transcriptional regulator [Acidiferrimicrobium sp. IK]MCU4183547.1 TetR/AcrR family transcriptional regulator [Acidiferrimicrobium sp. IK]
MSTTRSEERPSRPMRADARRNYDALLAAAEEAFAAHGSEASLDEIAKGAGVGIGTLYRHFPTRQDLLEAVYLRRVDDLRAEAETLLSSPDPDGAFAEWLRKQMVFGRKGRCMAASVMASVMDKKMQEGTDLNLAVAEMKGSGQALLQRAQAAGRIRRDVALTDILRMVHGILMVNEQQADSDATSKRMLDVVIAGLRP